MTREVERWMELQAQNYDSADDLAGAAAAHFDIPLTAELEESAREIYDQGSDAGRL